MAFGIATMSLITLYFAYMKATTEVISSAGSSFLLIRFLEQNSGR